MPRAMKGAARRQAKNRWLKMAKGNRGSRRNCWRKIKETVIKGDANATKHRRTRKRDYRNLWIIRVNAAVTERGMSYSRFIAGLKLAGIVINRKMLSQVAIEDPAGFDAIFAQAKDAWEKHLQRTTQATQAA